MDILTSQTLQELLTNEKLHSALLSTLAIAVLPVIVLLFFPSFSKGHAHNKTPYLLVVGKAFAAGGLMGDVFLHMLPEAFETQFKNQSESGGVENVGMAVLLGFFVFFIVEHFTRVFGASHDDDKIEELFVANRAQSPKQSISDTTSNDPAKKAKNILAYDTNLKAKKILGDSELSHNLKAKKLLGLNASDSLSEDALSSITEGSFTSTTILNLITDSMHNFTDGLSIGVAHSLSSSSNNASTTPMITTLSILLHEIPHTLGDYSILLSSGFTKPQAILMQLVTSIPAVTGCIVGFLLGGIGGYGSVVVGGVASGGFLYLAGSCLVVEAVNESSSFMERVGTMLAFAAGVGMLYAVVVLEGMGGSGHSHGGHGHDEH